MAPKKKRRAQKENAAFERVYLILTLVVVAGVAIFLGYVVGQYAIQAATNALDREILREGDRVRQQVAETARRTQADSVVVAESAPTADEQRPVPEESTKTGTGSDSARALTVVPQRSAEVPQSKPAMGSQSAEVTPISPPRTDVGSIPGKQLYRVQVGAFSSEANARNLAQELKEKGYPVLVSPGDLHRVQVGAFAERANAEGLKRELEAKGFPAAIVAAD